MLNPDPEPDQGFYDKDNFLIKIVIHALLNHNKAFSLPDSGESSSPNENFGLPGSGYTRVTHAHRILSGSGSGSETPAYRQKLQLSYQVLVHAGNVVGSVYGAGRGSNGGGQDQVLRGKGGVQVLKYSNIRDQKRIF